jgi:hypothetical protein
MLTKPQATALLRKYTKGDFGVHHWPTIKALLAAGMIVEQDKAIVVTPAGRAYCDEHHMEMSL